MDVVALDESYKMDWVAGILLRWKLRYDGNKLAKVIVSAGDKNGSGTSGIRK